MKGSTSSAPRETRFGFRIAAGVIAALLLLVSLPLAATGAIGEGWEALFIMAATIYACVGLAVASWTGKWFGS